MITMGIGNLAMVTMGLGQALPRRRGISYVPYYQTPITFVDKPVPVAAVDKPSGTAIIDKSGDTSFAERG